MSWKIMKVAPLVQGENFEFSYEEEVELSGVSVSDWILIPRGVNIITVTLSVGGGGKGKVQASTDNVSVIKSGSPIAVDWDFGEVSVNTQDAGLPPTAIRLSQTFAGTTKLTVRAQ